MRATLNVILSEARATLLYKRQIRNKGGGSDIIHSIMVCNLYFDSIINYRLIIICNILILLHMYDLGVFKSKPIKIKTANL